MIDEQLFAEIAETVRAHAGEDAEILAVAEYLDYDPPVCVAVVKNPQGDYTRWFYREKILYSGYFSPHIDSVMISFAEVIRRRY